MSGMKVVFHIDMDSTPIFELMLGNIRNLLNAVDAKVVVVANGYAPKLFTKPSIEKYKSELQGLIEKGVKFLVCGNAIRNLVMIKEDEISELCEIIPAGVVKLIELQNEGFAYIKP